MYGYTTRIGAMIPSLNTAVEPEFNAMVPDDISVHVTRLPLNLDNVIENLKNMSQGAEVAAQLLADAGVNIIAYACTTGSLINGVGWDRELAQRIEKSTGIPATTTSTAVINAFTALDVHKVVIASPYIDAVNQIEMQFIEQHGIQVLQIKSLLDDLRTATPADTYKLVHEVDLPDADAVFITCAGLKSVTIIEQLEQELQKPVFSSNTATVWEILNLLGVTQRKSGFGSLMNLAPGEDGQPA
jgi:maleate isomerase